MTSGQRISERLGMERMRMSSEEKTLGNHQPPLIARLLESASVRSQKGSQVQSTYISTEFGWLVGRRIDSEGCL